MQKQGLSGFQIVGNVRNLYWSSIFVLEWLFNFGNVWAKNCCAWCISWKNSSGDYTVFTPVQDNVCFFP